MEKPTKEIIREFIEKIEIHSDKQVDIYFNFKPLQELNNNFSVAKKYMRKSCLNLKIIAFGVVTLRLKCNQRTRVRLIHFKLVCLAKYQFFSNL